MILPDVNVLLYGFRRDSARHDEYREWLEDVVNGEAAYGLSSQVMSAVIRISTHRRIYLQPSTLAEALKFCEVLLQPEKLTKFHALLTKDGAGTIASVNHWGKRTLAYKVKKKDTGYYVVAKFETDGAALPEYERLVKLDEGVLRYLVVQAGEEPRPPAAAPANGEAEKEDDE